MRPYVMVVDDDEDIRELLAELLSAAGYQVATAASGAEALVMMRSAPPSFVVLDLMMPRMNGWQLAATMAADADLARIPYCVVTASMPPPPHPTGAIKVLRKPIASRELLAIVSAAIGAA